MFNTKVETKELRENCKVSDEKLMKYEIKFKHLAVKVFNYIKLKCTYIVWMK